MANIFYFLDDSVPQTISMPSLDDLTFSKKNEPHISNATNILNASETNILNGTNILNDTNILDGTNILNENQTVLNESEENENETDFEDDSAKNVLSLHPSLGGFLHESITDAINLIERNRRKGRLLLKKVL